MNTLECSYFMILHYESYDAMMVIQATHDVTVTTVIKLLINGLAYASSHSSIPHSIVTCKVMWFITCTAM